MAVKTDVKFQLEHEQKDQFEEALDRHCARIGEQISQAALLRSWVAKFCGDNGVKFSLRKRRQGSRHVGRNLGAISSSSRRPS